MIDSTVTLAVSLAASRGYTWEDGSSVLPGDEARVNEQTLLDLEELAARGMRAVEIVEAYGGWGVYAPHCRREVQ